MNQAARIPASAPAARSELKYRSSVLMAASKTKWQSEHESRWRLISPSTEAESRPSKYQQIKWIVSLQLISPVPQVPKTTMRPAEEYAFPTPNPAWRPRILSAYKSNVYPALQNFDAGHVR